MKKCLLIIITSIILTNLALGQRPDNSAEIKNAMAKLSVLNGEWEGRGWSMSMSKEKEYSNVHESFAWKLDNTVLTIEGLGESDSGQVVHNAFAIVFYDADEKQYKMQSHLADGTWSDAKFEVIEENKKFRWTIEHGATITYAITIDGENWNEVGTYYRTSMNEPFVFFEMNLQKK